MSDPFSLSDPEATRRAGALLAPLLQADDVVALLGDLGAGKTALTKAAIAALCDVDEDEVTSPTFVLVRDYEGDPPAAHMDAYRLASGHDLEALDLALGADGQVWFVEWAERVEDALPADRLVLELDHQDGGRSLRISGLGPRGEALAAAYRAALAS